MAYDPKGGLARPIIFISESDLIQNGGSYSPDKGPYKALLVKGNLDLGGFEIVNFSENIVTVSPGSTYTVNWSEATIQEVTLTANLTLSFSDLIAGRSLTLVLIQGGAGNFTITWPASVDWPGGTAPVLSTAAGAVDVITLFVRADGTTVYGFLSGKAMT